MDFDHGADPFSNLDRWLQDAEKIKYPEANAMALATVGKNGRPTSRIVLYKGLIRGGLSFFTNYDSAKAKDFLENSCVAANFFWPPLARQIRVEGTVAKLTRDESENYFRQRPRLSQIGAWASQQSQKMKSLGDLQQRFSEMEKKFSNMEIPCPPFWGGYHIIPDFFEFWLGREGRLHERYCYDKISTSEWQRYLRFP